MSSSHPHSPSPSTPKPRMSLPPQARGQTASPQPAAARDSPPPRVRSGSQPTTPTEGSYIPWHVRNPSPPQQAPSDPHPPAPAAGASQPANRARFDSSTPNPLAPYAYDTSHQIQHPTPQRPEPYRSSSMPGSAARNNLPSAPPHHRARTLSRSSSIASDSSDSVLSGGEQWDEKRRKERKARRLGKSLSEVAFEAVSEEKMRKREKSRKVWRVVGWVTGCLLEGWVIWLMIRYFVAFLLYTDDSARRRMNLAFFIVSLYSCLTTLVPLLYLLPLFPSRHQHTKLVPLVHILLVLSSLSVLAIAALQIVLFKLWQGEPAPRGFVGRCGWDMDAVWGAPTTCGSYRWNGWVGVLSARFAGSFILVALLHVSILLFMLNSPRSIHLPTFPEESSEQSLIPTTLLDRHHPRLLSEEFEHDRSRRYRQSSNTRSARYSRKGSHYRSDLNRYRDEGYSEPEATAERTRERTYTGETYTGNEDRFQTGYLRPVDHERSRKPDYPRDAPVVDLSDSAQGQYGSSQQPQQPSKGWTNMAQHPPPKSPSPPGAAVIARKPVRYTTSSAGHGSGSDDFSDDGDTEDAYTSVPVRSARTSTFGPTPATSPQHQTRSNLSTPNRPTTRAAHPLSPPRLTIPPPPDFSPDLPALAGTGRFTRSAPAPTPSPAAAFSTPLYSPESPLDSSRYPFPNPPDPLPTVESATYHAHGYVINPFSYSYTPPQNQRQQVSSSTSGSSSDSDGGATRTVSQGGGQEGVGLGRVWESDEEVGEGGFEVGGGRGFVGGERPMKRLSTIASETEREEEGRVE